MVGIANAAHAEYDPDADAPLIAPAACPVDARPDGVPRLWGKLRIRLAPETLAFRIYGEPVVGEEYTCNFELNPRYQAALEAGGLRVSGRGENGEARVVELTGHRFFLASLFLPQLSSVPGHPHPVIREYLQACVGFKGSRGSGAAGPHHAAGPHPRPLSQRLGEG